MLCSKCSEIIKPIVALDIDGTLGDYYGHIVEFAEMYTGRRLPYGYPRYDQSEPHRAWFCRAFAIDVTEFRAIKLAYRQSGLKRDMPAYPGARELTHSIREAGAEVWITTTRPWQRFDRIDPDTLEWLKRNGLVFDGLIYDDDKVEMLYNRVDDSRVVAILDDLEEIIRTASNLYGPGVPILRRNAYNRAINWEPSLLNLADARAEIVARVKHWTDTKEIGA